MKKRIFGKVFEFVSGDRWDGYLDESVGGYSDASASVADVIVTISDKPLEFEAKSTNPRTFQSNDGCFLTDFGSCQVEWRRNSDLQIKVYFKIPSYSGLVGFIRRVRSVEYSSSIEWFEQVLHELVLIPATYFFSDLALIHSACIGNGQGGVLLTGTGGVGKSSALLSFIQADEYSFVADDVCVIDGNGVVYGNLAWPKVYGYNTIGNGVDEVILNGRSFFDKWCFYFRRKMNPISVRRKARPSMLFPALNTDGIDIIKVILLFKGCYDQMTLVDIDKFKLSDACIKVMLSEYQVFHNFINWEEYSAIIENRTPLISMGEVVGNWRRVMNSAFNCNLHKVSIPIDCSFQEYQVNIKRMIIS